MQKTQGSARESRSLRGYGNGTMTTLKDASEPTENATSSDGSQAGCTTTAGSKSAEKSVDAFEIWWEGKHVPDSFKDLVRSAWDAGRSDGYKSGHHDKNEEWILRLAGAYARGGKDALDRGIG